MTVWLVWTEQGEYENWTRDLRGVFATEALARAFACELEVEPTKYNTIEVGSAAVLTVTPERCDSYRWAAHVLPDGTEDSPTGEGDPIWDGLGYHRDHQTWPQWKHEVPRCEGKLSWNWNTRRAGEHGEAYIEVTGWGKAAVEIEYARLLEEARRQYRALTVAAS